MSFNNLSQRKLLARPGEYVADPDTESQPSQDFMIDLGDDEIEKKEFEVEEPTIHPDYSSFYSSSGWRSLISGPDEKAADPDSEGSQPPEEEDVVILPSADGMVGGVFVPADTTYATSLEAMQKQLQEQTGSDTDDFMTPQGSLRSGKSGSTGKEKFMAAHQTMEELEQMSVPKTVTKTNPRPIATEGGTGSNEPPTPIKDNRSNASPQQTEEPKNGVRNGIIVVTGIVLFFVIMVGIAVSRNRKNGGGEVPAPNDPVDMDTPSPTPPALFEPTQDLQPTQDLPTAQPALSAAFFSLKGFPLGQSLDNISDCDECEETLPLPFAISWPGAVSEITNVTVSTDGLVRFLGCGLLGDSCGEIHVVDADLDPSVSGEIWVAALPPTAVVGTRQSEATSDGQAFVVSWEFIPFHSSPSTFIYAQATIFPNGNVLMCWGDGFPGVNSFRAGVSYSSAGVFVSANGDIFDSDGYSIAGIWPTDQCQFFDSSEISVASSKPTISPNVTSVPVTTSVPISSPSPTTSSTTSHPTSDSPVETAETPPPLTTPNPTPKPTPTTPNPTPKPSPETPSPTKRPARLPTSSPSPKPTSTTRSPTANPTEAPQAPALSGVCAPTVGPCVSTYEDLAIVATVPAFGPKTIALCGKASIEVASQLIIDHDSTTMCCQGPGRCELQSTGADRILSVVSNSVTLRDITFIGGVTEGDGGNVAITGGGKHKIIRCAFHDGRSALNGGNLFVSDSALVSMERSSFLRGDTASGGGGVAIRDVAEVIIDDCVFEKNSAGDGGGVVVSSVNSISVTRTIFAENSAEVGGGLLLTDIGESPQFTLQESSFFGNIAFEGPMGALYHFTDEIEFSMVRNFGIGNLVPTDPNGCSGFSFTLADAFCIEASQNIRFAGGSRAPTKAPTNAPSTLAAQTRSIVR